MRSLNIVGFSFDCPGGELPVLPHTSFNGSQLIRALEKLGIAPGAPATQSLAEGLSLWLDWTDAISLSNALQAAPGQGPAHRRSQAPAAARTRERPVTAEFNSAQEEMTQSITADPLFAADGAQCEQPELSLFRRRYLDHQRAMESRINALRAKVRAALSETSAELASLAALDAVMDKALGARERQLLAALPVLLGNHYERCCLAAPPPRQPSELGRQMQAVLLAELDIRLQPVAGMIEALETSAKTNPAAPTPVARARRTAAQA